MPSTPHAPTPAAGRTQISVNGASHEVAPGGCSPRTTRSSSSSRSSEGSAKIAIEGGAYANGAATITLKKGGKPITLVNTADGTRYCSCATSAIKAFAAVVDKDTACGSGYARTRTASA